MLDARVLMLLEMWNLKYYFDYDFWWRLDA
jgi:hypothetical protein